MFTTIVYEQLAHLLRGFIAMSDNALPMLSRYLLIIYYTPHGSGQVSFALVNLSSSTLEAIRKVNPCQSLPHQLPHI